MKSHEKKQPSQPRMGDTVPRHVPLSGQTLVVVVLDGVTLLQFNVEGLIKAKVNFLTQNKWHIAKYQDNKNHPKFVQTAKYCKC